MTTYSKKYFNEETQQWEPLYSTEGRSAYETAKLNGYTGTEEEFNKVLSQIPGIIASIENYPTEGSKNLITSGGVYQAVKDSETSAEETHQELLNEISNVNTTLSTEISTVNTNLTTKITQVETTTIPNAIKAAIVDNLDTEDSNKALSATQGKILKTMISNLANLRIEVVNELPSTGETNVIYLVKKSGTNPDTHDEYVYVEGSWEKIGNTEIDLSNYYTKDQVYSKTEVDEKLSDANLGDVIAEAPFTTADRVIISGSAGKTVKDSGILLTNLATKEFVNQFEPEWNKIVNKPETFVPSTHTHTISQITDFPKLGTLASKDKIDESDLNFDIPEEVTIDSSLSTSSVNPVQNKVITAALNNKAEASSLNNYYTKSEVDEKIGSVGGGDVMASGDLATDYIIVGAGTKSIKNSGQTLSNLALKNEIPSLEGYATQSWVTNQGYLTTIPAATSSSYGGIQIGYSTSGKNYAVQLSNGKAYVNVPWTDTNTTYSAGTNISISGTTINCTYAYTLPAATSSSLGGVKIGSNITVASGTISLTSGNVTSALGYTPAKTSDIPEILPNPYALSIIAGGSTTNYTGSSASNLNLDNIFAKTLSSVDTPGKVGIFYGDASLYSVNNVYVTSNNPDAVIVVPTATTVTFGSNYVKMDGLDVLSGGSYKCYCITYIKVGLVLVNGAIYG